MDEELRMTDEQKVGLMQVWMLGFLDYVAGGEVTNDDQITTEFGAQLMEMATQAIEEATPQIAPFILENPIACHQAVYEVGRKTAEDNTVPSPPISLN